MAWAAIWLVLDSAGTLPSVVGMPIFQLPMPKTFCASSRRSPALSLLVASPMKAVVQDIAKSAVSVFPVADSLSMLWKVWPLTAIVFGQETASEGLAPALSMSAAEVIIFMVEPG